MRIVALDLSLSASGVAVFDEGLISVDTLRPPGLKGMPRLEWIMRRVVELTTGVDLTLIEGYAFARPNQAHQIGELGGVVRLALHTRRVPYVEVAPAALKKLATGKGNAGKELVLVEAVKRLGYSGADNNQADARWLLQAAIQHYGLPGSIELPKSHLQALEKITWPVRAAA
jgi:crossover junction endodeoxyribonuclease RuvC